MRRTTRRARPLALDRSLRGRSMRSREGKARTLRLALSSRNDGATRTAGDSCDVHCAIIAAASLASIVFGLSGATARLARRTDARPHFPDGPFRPCPSGGPTSRRSGPFESLWMRSLACHGTAAVLRRRGVGGVKRVVHAHSIDRRAMRRARRSFAARSRARQRRAQPASAARNHVRSIASRPRPFGAITCTVPPRRQIPR